MVESRKVVPGCPPLWSICIMGFREDHGERPGASESTTNCSVVVPALQGQFWGAQARFLKDHMVAEPSQLSCSGLAFALASSSSSYHFLAVDFITGIHTSTPDLPRILSAGLVLSVSILYSSSGVIQGSVSPLGIPTVAPSVPKVPHFSQGFLSTAPLISSFGSWSEQRGTSSTYSESMIGVLSTNIL